MNTEQEQQCLDFVAAFVAEMRDTMPHLSEEWLLPVVRVATSTLLGAVLHLDATPELAQRVAILIRVAMFRAYHPGRPFAIVIDDEAGKRMIVPQTR